MTTTPGIKREHVIAGGDPHKQCLVCFAANPKTKECPGPPAKPKRRFRVTLDVDFDVEADDPNEALKIARANVKGQSAIAWKVKERR